MSWESVTRNLSRDFSQPIRSGWEKAHSEAQKLRDAPILEGPHSVGVLTLKIKIILIYSIVQYSIPTSTPYVQVTWIKLIHLYWSRCTGFKMQSMKYPEGSIGPDRNQRMNSSPARSVPADWWIRVDLSTSVHCTLY